MPAALVEGRMMIAGLPTTKRRRFQRRPRKNLPLYSRFFARVQYGPNLYIGYFSVWLGIDPFGLKKDRLGFRSTFGPWTPDPADKSGLNFSLGINYTLPFGDSGLYAFGEANPLGAGFGLEYPLGNDGYGKPDTQFSIECRMSFLGDGFEWRGFDGDKYLGLYLRKNMVKLAPGDIPLIGGLLGRILPESLDLGLVIGYEYPLNGRAFGNGDIGRFLVGLVFSKRVWK